MRIATRRFGLVDVREREIIAFPERIQPFRAERYVIITRLDEEPFAWLQATEGPDPCFCVVPFEAVGGAERIPVTPRQWRAMGLELQGRPLVLCLVTIGSPPAESTVNLLAPLVIDTETRLGRQVVLAGDAGLLRAPLLLLERAA